MVIKKIKETFTKSVEENGLLSRLLEYTPILAVVAALVIGAGLILIAGENPLYIYIEMLNGAFGTPRRIAETFVRVTPLLFGGLGILIAFKTSTWNVGGPGQLYMGALAAILVGVYITGLPGVIHLPLVIVASFAFGGVLALIPAILKTQFNMSDVVTTVIKTPSIKNDKYIKYE